MGLLDKALVLDNLEISERKGLNSFSPDIKKMMSSLGYDTIKIKKREYYLERRITPLDVDSWFNTAESPSRYVEAFHSNLKASEIDDIIASVKKNLAGSNVNWRKYMLYITARKPSSVDQ